MTTAAVIPGTIEIWLNKNTSDSAWQVVNARLRFPRHGQRILLDTPQPVHEVFAPQVATALQEYLGSATDTAVFSDTDFALELPGLQLSGLRVLTRVAPDGSGTASVRFVRANGDPGLVLHQDLRGKSDRPIDMESVALPVLQDLLYPALEAFDHILEHGLSEKDAKVLAARVKTMRAKRDELSDYISLLTRFIEAGAMRDANETPKLPKAPLALSSHHTLTTRDLHWEADKGTVRGEDVSILHGHHLHKTG